MIHRVGQFVSHLRAQVGPDEAALARQILPAGAWALFEGMPVADRRHGLDVVGRLLGAGRNEPDLLAAALLHDAAKGHRMRLWHRVTGVLLEAVAPRALARLASPDPGSWRHPLHLYLHHAELSAAAASQAGCSARTAAFIRGTVDGASAVEAELAKALRTADEAS